MNKQQADQAYIDKLVQSWSEVFKGGQLTLWVLLAVSDEPRNMASIRTYIAEHTGGVIAVDDASLYRSLRRYYLSELIEYTEQVSAKGPKTKLYRISPLGQSVLHSFLSTNLIPIYYKPANMALIKGVTL